MVAYRVTQGLYRLVISQIIYAIYFNLIVCTGKRQIISWHCFSTELKFWHK